MVVILLAFGAYIWCLKIYNYEIQFRYVISSQRCISRSFPGYLNSSPAIIAFLHAKQFPLPVDTRGMTDREKDIIAVVWNDLVLRKQLEDDPYSLSKNDLKLLELNDAFNKKLTEINDQLQASKRQQAIKAYLQ